MQYFKPAGNFFVGDCMPYFHDGLFHLYYLLDENHHQSLNGLGGHQWAHASTTDLVHWTQHPLALPISDEQEGSICTGSVYFHRGKHCAFYATRGLNRHQRLSLAVSDDAIHFVKINPDLFFPPQPDYSPLHFRDPCPFLDPETGIYHLLISAQLASYPLSGRGGCLAHLTSPDLDRWTMQEPFLIPGYADVPECSDFFFWNGWYYLIFSTSLTAHYRMSRRPLGPWIQPPVDTLDGPLARVMKTAPFTGGRRIGAAWLGTRAGDKDDGKPQWGGHLLFRELIQHIDGTLGCKIPSEMVPPCGESIPLTLTATTVTAVGDTAPSAAQGERIRLDGRSGLSVVQIVGVPHNAHIAIRLTPTGRSGDFGLRLRSTGDYEHAYALAITPAAGTVTLGNQTIYGVAGLDQPLQVVIVLKDDISDVCISITDIGTYRCIVNRCPELHGNHLYLFAHNVAVTVDEIEIRPLL